MKESAGKDRALLQAALTITSELSLDAVLQKLTDVAKDLARARYAALGVARADRKGLSRFVVAGVTHQQIEAIGDWPRGLGLLGALLQDPTPLRLRHIHDDPRSVGFPPHHPGMTSFLGVPITSKGDILGNFYLTDKLGADEFSQEDEDLIGRLGAFAAIAIENARLYTETDTQLRRKIQEVERTTRQLKYLVELASLLPSGPGILELPLDDALTRATTLLGDACGLYLFNDEGVLTRKILIHRDPDRARAATSVVEASWDNIYNQVVKRTGSLFVPDIDFTPAPVITIDALQMREYRFSAAMVLPVKSSKQVHGAFLSLGSQPLKFTLEDFAFGTLIAQRLAAFIENYNLLLQLNDALKARDEFISIATHELKTPVSVLVAYADLAIKSLQSSPSKLSLAVETIKRQSIRLAMLADELLDVARLRAGRLNLAREKIDVSSFVMDVFDRFLAQLSPEDRARFRVSVPSGDVWGQWDSLRLEQVLINLLSNALKYTPQGGDIEIRVDRLDQDVMFSVKDQGIGIPKDHQARIFEPFFRSSSVEKANATGAGLGLHISKQIVEQHGGRMWFESEEDEGSCFYFSLPLASAYQDQD